MKKRLISAFFMLFLLVFVRLGGFWLLGLVFVLSIMSIYEFTNAFKKLGIKACIPLSFVLTLLLYSGIGLDLFTDIVLPLNSSQMLSLWLFSVVFSGLFQSLLTNTEHISNGIVTIVSLIYIAFFFAHFVFIVALPDFSYMGYIVAVCAFGCDVFAYIIGCSIGKHKLCEKISPHKTVEGFIGGICGAALLCACFAYFVCRNYLFDCIIIGLAGGALSQCGDLIASMFKRKAGIKDYSNLIPGHGGILDRFDSFLAVAPFVYYYVVLFMAK